MIKPWTIGLQQWKELDNSQTSWLYAPNYQLNSQRREKICWQSLFFFLKGESGVQSVKDLYFGKYKSSHELCIIIINLDLTPRLDTVMYSHGDLNKGQC